MKHKSNRRFNMIRKVIFLLSLLFFSSLLSLKGYAADVHAVIDTSRTYMDFTRKYTNEYWIAKDKTYRKADTFIWITRKDLGLAWSINLRDNSYIEEKITTPEKSAQAPSEKEVDIHTLGWEYKPQYYWSIKETGEKKDINGIRCELVTAHGEADFSEISLDVWLVTEANIPGSAELYDLTVDALKGDMVRSAIVEVLMKFKNRAPIHRIEIIENPIAPTIRQESQVKTLEKTEPPPKIYELPDGLKKISMERN